MNTIHFSFEQFPQLELPRVRLRQLRSDDIDALFALLSDPEVMKYNDDPMVKREQVVTWFERQAPEFQEKRVIRWGIARQADDHLIGTILISNWSKKFSRAEIGYDLAQAQWGQGIMTEVLQAVVAFGFEQMGLNRIDASFAPENIGSRRVLEKNGFQYEGTLREYWYMNGRFWDATYMGLLRREYLQK